jgi:hypothetical protein
MLALNRPVLVRFARCPTAARFLDCAMKSLKNGVRGRSGPYQKAHHPDAPFDRKNSENFRNLSTNFAPSIAGANSNHTLPGHSCKFFL